MRKILFTVAVTTLIGGMLSGCLTSSKKVENAEKKVEEAKEAVLDAKSDLNLARQDSVTEIQKFKIEFENKIIANEKSIEELIVKIRDADKENKALYEAKVADLELRNRKLKIKLANYKETGMNQWQTFRSEFKHDMDELAKAFSDFRITNTK